MAKRRIGIVGFGHLGEYLANCISSHDQLEIAFVWNRSPEPLKSKVKPDCILNDLKNFTQKHADLIIEVAHPSISEEYGDLFLQHADYLIGSPTALANPQLETRLRIAASSSKHGLYIPNGAFWGSEDIQRMADSGTLKGLKITMTKHPNSFKLNGYLREKNSTVTDKAVTLYSGPIRQLCPLAPNNVNTMAAAAIAAHNLGFDNVIGSLVADPNLTDFHIVEVEVTGPITDGKTFNVLTVRRNPSIVGEVTGNATYASFFSSLLHAHGKGCGIHFC